MTTTQRAAMRSVLDAVAAERERQHARWGEQVMPDGTGGAGSAPMARMVKRYVDDLLALGEATWRDVLREELFEACAETEPARLRTELLQVAAVAIQWVEAIDRRAPVECPRCQGHGEVPDTNDPEGGGLGPCPACSGPSAKVAPALTLGHRYVQHERWQNDACDAKLDEDGQIRHCGRRRAEHEAAQ